MYARGMTVREIQAFLQEQYGTEVSPEFISSVTDEVMVEVTAWQSRPLEPMYPVVFFDALRVKIREDAVVRNKAVYLALGVLPDGSRDILGLWIEGTEGAKFWMKVFNDLKTRGVNDILIAVTDGLKGMPEALETVFPATTLQTCIVHLIRNSLAYANWKERKALAGALKPIYTAVNAEAAEAELNAFAEGAWGEKFPTVVAAWRNAWDRVIPFFVFPPAVRKVIYTTNAIENVNAQLRKIIKTRGHFPSDEAATKLIWLALRNITAAWSRSAHDWKTAMNQFAILYADRFVLPAVQILTRLEHENSDTPGEYVSLCHYSNALRLFFNRLQSTSIRFLHRIIVYQTRYSSSYLIRSPATSIGPCSTTISFCPVITKVAGATNFTSGACDFCPILFEISSKVSTT
eukprot:TRINITY_DN118_c0_g1_i2.p2 TRINITY_DN118_c0_g1~~TRINITY_DN118_c0_g1_i2.p2  ORF type:complete len:404 (-),score=41.75 TRINITY_DN118_c0_g1_i2:1443-2654(-)